MPMNELEEKTRKAELDWYAAIEAHNEPPDKYIDCVMCLRPALESCKGGFCEQHCKEVLAQGSLHEL